MGTVGNWRRFYCDWAFDAVCVFRFHYVLNRMHSAAMGDSLGILFIIFGLMILSGFHLSTLKLALIIVFFWLAGPVSSHMICKLEVLINENLKEECEVPEDGGF